MTKIVVNKRPGGFELSSKAQRRYLEFIGKDCYFYKQTKVKQHDGEDEYVLISDDESDELFFSYTSIKYFGDVTNYLPHTDLWYYDDLNRTDSALIHVIEELGDDANGPYAKLEIIEIPDNVEWEIDECSGYETIHEKHRIW